MLPLLTPATTKTLLGRSPALRNHIRKVFFSHFAAAQAAESEDLVSDGEMVGSGRSISRLDSACLDQNKERGIQADLNCCFNHESLIDATRVHGKILKLAFATDSVICDRLLDVYLDHGDFKDAVFLFDEMPNRTFYSWNQIITAGFLSRNHFPKCTQYLIRMFQSLHQHHCHLESVIFDHHPRTILGSVLRSCLQNHISVRYVRHLHGMIIRHGFGHDFVICNPLLDFYAKNHRTDLAWSVFEGSSSLDRTSWVAMISGFSQNQQEQDAFRLYSEMRRSAVIPTTYALSSVLSACTKAGLFREATQVHGQAVKLGLSSETYVCNALVSVYSRSGDMKSAEQIFQNNISTLDRITYNSLISGYAQVGAGGPALQVYKAMEGSGIRPDCVTAASLLSSCAAIVAPIQGLQLHGYTIKAGFSEDIIIEGSLLDFYVNCFNNTEKARGYFDSTRKENVVLWNVMLMAYGRSGDIREASRIFSEMQFVGVRPNQYTYPSLLRTCTSTPDAFRLGELIHGLVIKAGFASNVYVSSTLIDMYAKGGELQSAREVLDRMPEKDVVSWTAMISGYAQHELFSEAIRTFRKMERNGIRIDNIGLASVLTACAGARDLKHGFEIHGRVTVAGYSHDLSVGNALISLYARCGRVSDAHSSFGLIGRVANQVSWNGLISGFAQSGHCEESLKLFVSMIRENSDAVGLDLFTYGSAGSAAANMADLKIGKQVHARMMKTSFDLEMEAGNTLITLYSKSGSISDARMQFSLMTTARNEVTWNAMITGYSQHGCGIDALDLFEQMKHHKHLSPNHVTFVGVLSACSHVGFVAEGLDYFASMSEKHHIIPCTEHYACVVDILGRAGELIRAKNFITEMPTSIPPDALIYRTLLSACRVHKNTGIGEFAAIRLLEIDPRDSATYVLLSNIYAVTRRWSCRDRIRKLMKDNGVRKEPGRSWIEVKNSIHAFFVGDKLHPLSDEIYWYLEELDERVGAIGYRRDRESFLHEEVVGGGDESDWRDFVHSERLAVALGVLSCEEGMKMIPIRVMKNLRICNDCHSWMVCVSKVVDRRIVLRDSYRFHHFQNGACSCRNYW